MVYELYLNKFVIQKKREEKCLYDFILLLAVYSVQIDLYNFWLAKLASTVSVHFLFLFILAVLTRPCKKDSVSPSIVSDSLRAHEL